jgi:Kef-type K+ transport system membrane component KefB
MQHFTLPFTDPVLIFSIVLFIILLAPTIARRINTPSIVGLILAGILVGPNGLNLLARDASIVLFGTVGLLYIMFLAGLEIDLNDFKKNRNRSLTFGALTFFIPMTLGTLTGTYILGFELISALLLASMFASHTLLAYPLASRLGISRNEAVTVTVGGTMITDTAALLVLAVIAGSTQGELNAQFWLRLAISFTIFVILVLYLFPKIAGWFFKNGEADGISQYIFVLAVIFTAAFLAELAGVEAIIGAFLAGLALNRLIPHTSPLMNRIEFVGNALFIPFFLIGVGMLVDLRVLFQGAEALLVAVTMTVVATGAKWLAAFGTQKIFGYSADERNVMFGLSNAQAAATLAAVLIGFNLGLLNENVLNGTIIMILTTCFISSFTVDRAGRRLAITESEKSPDLSLSPERILVPIANPNTIEMLMDLAILIKNPKSAEPIYPLVVVKDDDTAKEKIAANQKMLERAVRHASATEHRVQIVSRVDLNIAGGIARAIKELMITEVVIGWNGQVSTIDRIFGSVLDNLLERSRQMILVSRIVQPLNIINKIVVVLPAHAELETGFGRWVHTALTLARQTGATLAFFGGKDSLNILKNLVADSRPAVTASFTSFEDWQDFLILSREIGPDDLFVVVSSRNESVSYNKHLDLVPAQLAKYFQAVSFVIIYPEQHADSITTMSQLGTR